MHTLLQRIFNEKHRYSHLQSCGYKNVDEVPPVMVFQGKAVDIWSHCHDNNMCFAPLSLQVVMAGLWCTSVQDVVVPSSSKEHRLGKKYAYGQGTHICAQLQIIFAKIYL